MASSRTTGCDRAVIRTPIRLDVAGSGPPSIVGRSGRRGLAVEVAQALDARQDLPLAVVEALLDVDGEDERAAGRPDAEGDGHRVLALVADGHRDAAHAQLLGAPQGPVVEADGGLAGGQADDLDLAPADAPDAQAEDLADGLLGRPAAGQVLRPVAHVGGLGVGQDAPREAGAEALQRGRGCARP